MKACVARKKCLEVMMKASKVWEGETSILSNTSGIFVNFSLCSSSEVTPKITPMEAFKIPKK